MGIMHTQVTARIVLLTACSLFAGGCGKRVAEPEGRQTRSSPAPSAASAGSAAASAAPAGPAGDAPPVDKVRIDDDVPLCVFSDYDERERAMLIENVHKVKVRAGSTVVMGAFAPGCINEACYAIPTLQCWIDSATPDGFVVHSHFSADHKRGTVCTKDCRRVTAGCETPVLKAGTYTVKYGKRTFSLRVPSVMKDPCFKLD